MSTYSNKFLDGDGLQTAWGLMKNYISRCGANIAGFMYDSSDFSSGKCTRITEENDPLGLVNFVPTTEAESDLGGSGGHSEFDNFDAIKTEKVTFATGDVMVKLPVSYCRLYTDGSKRYYYIGDKPFEGSYLAPWSGRYIGRYQTNGATSPVSKSGEKPTGSVSITDFRTSAQSKGTGWGIMDWAEWSFIQYGIMLEYLSADSQGVIGYGNDTYNGSTGGTDNMSFHTGTMASSRSEAGAVQYRYIEYPWGNNYTWCDGVLNIKGVHTLSTNPSAYNSTTGYGYEAISVTSTTSGEIKTTLCDETKPWCVGFPIEITSNDDYGTYFHDYGDLYYSSSETVYALYVGRCAHVNAGAFYFYTGYTVSSPAGNIGSRLSYNA